VTLAMRRSRRIPLLVATLAAAMLAAAAPGGAQTERTPSGLFKMQQKRDEPVRIASLSLEVRDKDKLATFSGSVHIIRGELEVRSETLRVFYDDMAGARKTVDGGRNQQQMRRLEARGAVLITQRNQRAAGDQADFDVRANTFTLNGNVVVTRCGDVMRGDRLFVDMKTGVSRMEGRVEGVFAPNSRDEGC
jgi:lipopolysaccharide export system protein LptA